LPRKFPKTFAFVFGLASVVIAPAVGHAGCANEAAALPVTRIVEIDTSSGPMFGSVTRQRHEPSFLRPKEVVLTFDDGPMPWVTKSILGTLDDFCTKATFFSVGRMALAYPATVKEIVARGHTLGSHTYSHPFNMPRMKHEAAIAEIERGLAAVTTAAGTPIAPFFRFTGLADSARLLAYLKERDIATFTVDAVSNDSYIHDPEKLVQRTMSEVRRNHGGIILFHDIKTTTAKALPRILASLKAEGFTVVHLTAKQPAKPLEIALRGEVPKLSLARSAEPGGKTLMPLHGAISPESTGSLPPQKTTSHATLHAAGAASTIAVGVVGTIKSTILEISGPPVIVDASEVAGDRASNGWAAKVHALPAERDEKAQR
jgi:peptidoglycan-N-acetylglucosamine deacetylase